MFLTKFGEVLYPRITLSSTHPTIMADYVDINVPDGFSTFLLDLLQRTFDTAKRRAHSTTKILTARPIQEIVNDLEILVPQSLPVLMQAETAPSRSELLSLPSSFHLDVSNRRKYNIVYLGIFEHLDTSIKPYVDRGCEKISAGSKRILQYKQLLDTGTRIHMSLCVEKALSEGSRLSHHVPLFLIRNIAPDGPIDMSSRTSAIWNEMVAVIQLLEHAMTGVFQAVYLPPDVPGFDANHWGHHLVQLSPWPVNTLPWDRGFASHAPLAKGVTGVDFSAEELAERREKALADGQAGRKILADIEAGNRSAELTEEEQVQVAGAMPTKNFRAKIKAGRALMEQLQSGEIDEEDLDEVQLDNIERAKTASRQSREQNEKAENRPEQLKLGRALRNGVKSGKLRPEDFNETEKKQYQLAVNDTEANRIRQKKHRAAKKNAT